MYFIQDINASDWLSIAEYNEKVDVFSQEFLYQHEFKCRLVLSGNLSCLNHFKVEMTSERSENENYTTCLTFNCAYDSDCVRIGGASLWSLCPLDSK
jgi:hypothetical protein